MVFLVVTYGYENWTIKKAEHRIDAFELWCWRRLWKVLWTARISNQSILKERLMLKLKLQYMATWCEELTYWKRPWCWERLRAGGEGDDRGWDGWMASLIQWTWVWVGSGSWWWTVRPGMLQFMGSQRVRHNWATELNWTELKWCWSWNSNTLATWCKELSNFIFTFHFPALEKEMATHSSVLAWKIPLVEEPGALQSMGSWRVGHDWATSLSLFTFMHWRRRWQPTPVFLPGESQGWESLVGCRLWGRTEAT